MTKRNNYKPFLVVTFVLLFLFLTPSSKVSQLRSTVFTYSAFLCKPFSKIRNYFKEPTTDSSKAPSISPELQALQIENEQLKESLVFLQKWCIHMQSENEEAKKNLEMNTFRDRLQPNTQALPARVILRENRSWSSFIWIDTGSENNTDPLHPVIAKDSPVVVGNTLVGIVESVEKQKSKVRLLTDNRLKPSVRVARGSLQKQEIQNHIQALLQSNKESKVPLLTIEAREELKELQRELGEETHTVFLAKGEIHGSKEGLYRSVSNILKGTGFNYEYNDSLGLARDLRSGIPKNENLFSGKAVDLIREGDLLVTSGLDGFFPPGIHVGIVTYVDKLQEGQATYAIEARAAVGNINDLHTVFVLSPLTTNILN